jgi:hypothetical protein
MTDKQEKLTDEQLYQLCLEEEKKKKIALSTHKGSYKDNAVDYEYVKMIYENSRDLK